MGLTLQLLMSVAVIAMFIEANRGDVAWVFVYGACAGTCTVAAIIHDILRGK